MKVKCLLSVSLIFVASAFSLGQSQEKVLYSFGSVPNDGINPVSSLIADRNGNLYGTTEFGGSGKEGTVFELSLQSDGTWSETILYNFCTLSDCSDGYVPLAGLVFDTNGNLYGTTSQGGTTCFNTSNQCGTVFELSPPRTPGSKWAFSIIYDFCSNQQNGVCLDGFSPSSQLIFDALGNLYGTTSRGGAGEGSNGTVFELSPGMSGWTETVLYNFCSRLRGEFCTDGSAPEAGVTFDKSGNLYGTTPGGGRFSQGVVYKLSPGAGGWTQTVLVDLFVSGGSYAPVSFDAQGNLYGTTQSNVFQLNVKHHSQRSRDFTPSTGGSSRSSVVIDPARKVLFGTTGGAVWEVDVARELVAIYTFCSQPNCADGGNSQAGLIEDAAGNLYGTTKFGGANGDGVVFEVTP